MTPPVDKERLWPPLHWEISAADAVRWFHERVRTVAARVRGFELAMGRAAEKGEIELALLARPLAEWDDLAETVFMYAGLCRDDEVEADAVPGYVEELAPVYAALNALREEVYGMLEGSAERVRHAEAATEATEAQIGERIPDLDVGAATADDEGPSDDDLEAGDTGSQSAGEDGPPTAAAEIPPGADDLGFDAPSMPISVDELRMRQAAESKPLPAKLELVDLLGHLPSEWVIAVFETLDLEEAEDEPSIRSPRATRYRAQLSEVLRTSAVLEAILDSVGEEACLLLSKIIAKRGLMDYPSVVASHGADDADGFFWGERPPASALSRLRRTGLVYVGAWRGQPAVVVPTDLVAALRSLLTR